MTFALVFSLIQFDLSCGFLKFGFRFVFFSGFFLACSPHAHTLNYQIYTQFFLGLNGNIHICSTITYKQKRNINNLDTSVPSIHSSGCDSGVGLTAQLNDASSKHILHLMRDSQRRNGCGDLINNKRGERCVCGFGAAGPHICSGAEDSR